MTIAPSPLDCLYLSTELVVFPSNIMLNPNFDRNHMEIIYSFDRFFSKLIHLELN